MLLSPPLHVGPPLLRKIVPRSTGFRSSSMMAQLATLSHRRFLPRNVFIVGGARTPIGGFLGAFKSIPAHVLGSVAISGALRRAGLEPEQAEQCTENIALRECISRTEQDTYAVDSYKRAAHAWKCKLTEQEGIEGVPVPSSEKPSSSSLLRQNVEEHILYEDEEYTKINLDKVAALKPVFKKEGTITAANASKMSDGAAAAVLMSEERVLALDLQPLARVISFADAAVAPAEFPLAPELAIRKALRLAGLSAVDYYEINEAFAAVVLLNARRLGLDLSRVNVHGGAISLGHPLGASGMRIVLTLINVLRCRDAQYGCAAICNGGGGATAVVLERQ